MSRKRVREQTTISSERPRGEEEEKLNDLVALPVSIVRRDFLFLVETVVKIISPDEFIRANDQYLCFVLLYYT